MTASTADVGALRRHVRASQHARSYPLLVIGALLLNYGAVNFGTHPVAWIYGAPLAFVIIWGLSKLNESKVGVGIGRTDYLVAAGFVFVASTAVTIYPFNSSLGPESLIGVWVAIVGLAVVAIALFARDGVLTTAGAVVVAAGALIGVLSHRYTGQRYGEGTQFLPQLWPSEWTAILGAVLAVAGLGVYLIERRRLTAQ
jgi:hypothetical protein